METFTGLRMRQFERLLKVVRERGGNRPGGGQPWRLTLADRVLLVTVYCRTNLTMQQLASLFGISPATVCRVILRLRPLSRSSRHRVPELSAVPVPSLRLRCQKARQDPVGCARYESRSVDGASSEQGGKLPCMRALRPRHTRPKGCPVDSSLAKMRGATDSFVPPTARQVALLLVGPLLRISLNSDASPSGVEGEIAPAGPCHMPRTPARPWRKEPPQQECAHQRSALSHARRGPSLLLIGHLQNQSACAC